MDFDVLLRDAVAKVCNVAPARVQPDTRLADLGVDSLSAAEILVEVEIQVGVICRLTRSGASTGSSPSAMSRPS